MTTTPPSSTAELAAKVAELERLVMRLAAADQLSSSTTSGSDMTVADAVDAAADAADAVPQLQDSVAELTGTASDLADAIRMSSEEVDARLELAHTDLALAQEQLDDAQVKLDDAFGQIGDLGTANEANAQAARDAAAAAAAAATTATNASTAAANAQSAASSASSAAAAANQAALDASGLAATKGRVIVQVSAPTGANADPNNLWIDISGSPAKNTPNRYNTTTSKWEPVTDQKALDAAAAASAAATAATTAQQTADAAKTAAGTAQSAATAAQSTADAAQQTAGTAASNAQAAITSAAAAQGTADTAKTNAATAQSAATAAQTAADTAKAAAAAAAARSVDFIKDPQFQTGADQVRGLQIGSPADGNGGGLNGATGWGRLTGNDNLTDGTSIPATPGRVYRFSVDVRPAAAWVTGTDGFSFMVWYLQADGATTSTYMLGNGWTFAAKTDAARTITWEYTVPATPGTSRFRPSLRAGNNAYIVSGFHVLDVTDAKVAQAAADAAQSTANAAKTAASTAQGTADLAKTNAATAQSAADAAQGTANTAKTNAATAQSAADGANAQALAAAGIANGKGKLIVQVSAPTGANAVAENLWVDISGTPPKNQPNRWNPTTAKWEPVTDQKVVDAAAVAATANMAAGDAKTAADNAATAASTAQTTANNAATAAAAAQATATGKPQILFGTGTPAGTAPQGSTWFQVDTAGSVIGQWQQTNASVTGSTWTARQLRSEVIANLDVGKLTAGTAVIVDAVVQQIATQTANIQKANIANLFVTAGATMSQATIEALFAQVVQAHKITADMIDVGSLNGITLTGAVVQTAQSGNRVVIDSSNVVQDGPIVGRIRFLPSSYTETNQSGVQMVPDEYGMSVAIGPLGEAPQTLIGSPRRLGNGGLNAQSRVDIQARQIEAINQLSTKQVIDFVTGFILADDSGWRNLGIPGAFTADGTAGASVRRTGQIVKLRGQVNINSGSLVTNTTIATLGAAQFGPSQAMFFTCPTGATSWARIRVLPDGGISIQGLTGAASYVQLDAITYMVDLKVPPGGGAPL